MDKPVIKRVLVWSGWLRLSHASIALAVAVLLLTGWLIVESPSLAGLALDLHYLASSLLIFGLLMCLKSVRVRTSESIAAMLKSRRNRQLLKQACIANNPVLAFRELITWGRARWPCDNINGLFQIRIRTRSSELAGELRRLDNALYADHSETWQGRALWRLVAAEHRRLTVETETREDSLPDLYPQRS